MAVNGISHGPIIEDEQEFLDDVEVFMSERGVPFERDGKVAGRPVGLHKLYKLVMERGGYDHVTAERMVWREIAKHFNLPSQHEGAMGYQLKLLYYKNLAAYEIERYWHEKAPPRRVLEDITAKGGDLRSRTEDFQPGTKSSMVNNDYDSQSDNDEGQRTPKQDKMDVDEQTSGSRYPSRLRQQPRVAQVFQPDPTPSRNMRYGRTTSSPQASPAPTQSYSTASSNPRDPSFNLERYEPRQPNALSLRPVPTPGSNADVFYQRKAIAKAATMPRVLPDYQDLLRPIIPPGLLQGPNIYQRCVLGLRSGIPEEQAFALHHLVKVSFERGDKFKLEGFPLLAEGLLEKALEITELAYGVSFEVSYNLGPSEGELGTLNAVHGTSNLHESLSTLPVMVEEADLEAKNFANRLERLNETILVIRNMITLEENAFFMSRMALFRDFLSIAISLPQQPRFAEFRQYALDIAEMVTRFFEMQRDDALYTALIDELDTDDRGKVLCALRAIYRFDAEAERIHPITGVTMETIERLVAFCLLDDDELVEASLNFLYVYTAFPENITTVLRQSPNLFPSIAHRLSSLLLHNARPHEETILNRAEAHRNVQPASIPVVPTELHEQLLQYPEPERSSRWLRCCFEESPQDDITQIAIWQAYSQRFQNNNPIAAAEFIKNVSSTFTGAQAQVIPGQPPRFIIKGIRARRVLVDLRMQPYFKCLWSAQHPSAVFSGQPPQQIPLCSTWHSTQQKLWQHILEDHCKIPRTENGKFDGANAQVPASGYQCNWITCRRRSPIQKPAEISTHVKTHLPDTPEKNRELIHSVAGEPLARRDEDGRVTKHVFYTTDIDEKGVACGIPFMSGLLLTNLARYVGRFGGNEKERQTLMSKIFNTAVRADLWHLVSVHKTLARLVIDLVDLIEKGEAADRKKNHHGEQEHDEEMTVF